MSGRRPLSERGVIFVHELLFIMAPTSFLAHEKNAENYRKSLLSE
jgi:hypothetical protein